jgi:hypothetical protein
MDISFAFLCDYASLAEDKVNALGIGIDTLYGPQVPVAHPILYVVARLRIPTSDSEPMPLSLRITDADGKDLRDPLTGLMEVPATSDVPAKDSPSTALIVLGLHNLRFPEYGNYSVDLYIHGDEAVRLPLRVAPAPNRPTPPRTRPKRIRRGDGKKS